MSSKERILVFSSNTEEIELRRWVDHVTQTGGFAAVQWVGETPVVLAQGPEVAPARAMPAPVTVLGPSGSSRLGQRGLRPEGTTVRIGDVEIGDGAISVFAGPCAVETPEQVRSATSAAKVSGAVGLRGGAFKPRTSPYAFQGLAWEGLAMLAEAREQTGLPILTEVLDPRHVAEMAGIADGLQIGARNMQNFELLREVGAAGKPVVLKRGFGCTVDELLGAAEYILRQGNDQVVLCERGIRTFEGATRFTLDISAIPLLKQRTHLPVMVDPSHSVGIPSLVGPVTLAAAAAGADALLIDVHANPAEARCDGKQALLPDDLHALMGRLELLAMGLGRKLAGVRQLETA